MTAATPVDLKTRDAVGRSSPRRLSGLLAVSIRLGIKSMTRLAKAVMIDPLTTGVQRLAVRALRRLKQSWVSVLLPHELRLWKTTASEVIAFGRARAHLGPNPEWTPRAGDQANLPKTRFDVETVTTADYCGIRKRYRGEKDVFLRELSALSRLGTLGLRVPAILDIDFDEPSLVMSAVVGRSLKQESIPESALDAEFVGALADDMQRIHHAGLLLGDLGWDNIVIGADHLPWWINFETTDDYSGLSWKSFRFLVDSDVSQFNHVFDTSLLTYDSLRRRLHSKLEPELQFWYSPAYLGAGLRTGPLWNLGAGWGRWEYLLSKSLPNPEGRRVLDIGANNGHNGLEMLRAGASEVVGVELNEERVAQGRFLKQAYEWSDGRTYDYVSHQADMRDIPKMGLGSFDMVTALCSLYYLTESEIAGLIVELSTMTPILVLQCNERRDIGRADDDTYRRASLEFNVSMLKANGFPNVEIIAPRGYERPLMIGRH